MQVRAQCTGTLESVTQSVSATGDGNTPYNFTFSKFDPNLGTLLSVNIRTSVTFTYTFWLENYTSTSMSPRHRISRDDEISSSSLLSPITGTTLTSPWYGPYTLAPNDGVTGSGPDYVHTGPLTIWNNYVTNNATVNNVADFMGVGSVNFTYSPYLGTSMQLGNPGYNGTVSETVYFTITYNYCNTNTSLADNIKAFTVTKKSDEQVDTRWFTTNETPGRIYTLQKSKDGSVFTPIKDFASVADNNQTGDYQYSYKPVNETGKLYFRVKQKDADGGISYSPVRSVEIGSTVINNRSLTLYPNPTANSATLLFGTQPGNWSVDIISLPGQVIRKLQFKNAVKADLNGDRSLSSGVYFLKITDQQTQRQYTQRLIVQ